MNSLFKGDPNNKLSEVNTTFWYVKINVSSHILKPIAIFPTPVLKLFKSYENGSN